MKSFVLFVSRYIVEMGDKNAVETSVYRSGSLLLFDEKRNGVSFRRCRVYICISTTAVAAAMAWYIMCICNGCEQTDESCRP